MTQQYKCWWLLNIREQVSHRGTGYKDKNGARREIVLNYCFCDPADHIKHSDTARRAPEGTVWYISYQRFLLWTFPHGDVIYFLQQQRKNSIVSCFLLRARQRRAGAFLRILCKRRVVGKTGCRRYFVGIPSSRRKNGRVSSYVARWEGNRTALEGRFNRLRAFFETVKRVFTTLSAMPLEPDVAEVGDF